VKSHGPWYASTWWKEVVFLLEGVGSNWFNSEVVRQVGDGERTSFWQDNWMGFSPFCEQFPRLLWFQTIKKLLFWKFGSSPTVLGILF